ncbi:MAG TPA: hypothetical protein VFS55_18335 [Dokdonella sp.]|nr:hypothetical protein [Dokdonella sp.]
MADRALKTVWLQPEANGHVGLLFALVASPVLDGRARAAAGRRDVHDRIDGALRYATRGTACDQEQQPCELQCAERSEEADRDFGECAHGASVKA